MQSTEAAWTALESSFARLLSFLEKRFFTEYLGVDGLARRHVFELFTGRKLQFLFSSQMPSAALAWLHLHLQKHINCKPLPRNVKELVLILKTLVAVLLLLSKSTFDKRFPLREKTDLLATAKIHSRSSHLLSEAKD